VVIRERSVFPMKKVIRNFFIIFLAMVVFAGYLPTETAYAATTKKPTKTVVKVQLNKTKATVYAGKTVQLKLKGTTKKVTWKSSNKAIATVYKGKVTTKKAGTVTITAKVGKKSYKCKVTVKKPYLNKVSASVYTGKTVQLKLTGATVKSYTSKNKAVATVTKKGLVTTKAVGTAKIVVKDTKGRSYNCSVIVKDPYLNRTDMILGVGDTMKLKLTGAAVAGWFSSDPSVVTVSEAGVITALRSGSAVITCIDDSGRTYTAAVTTSCYYHVTVEELIKEPTCKVTGMKKFSCLTCDYSYRQILSTIDHEHEFAYTTEGTCEDYGKNHYVCKWCQDEYTEDAGEPLGHDYVYGSTVSPTQKGPGYDIYHCSRCDEEEQRNEKDYSPTASQVYADMTAKKSVYPEGIPWNNDNFYGWNAGYYSGGYCCAGFAFMLSDAAFGYMPATKHTDFDAIKPGDILRVNNDSHSVVVIAIEGDTYTLAEGNYNNSVHWGRTMTLAKIKETGTYVMTRYPQ